MSIFVVQLVERGTKLVLEQIVTTIASVADTVEKDFVVYYDRLMPCLKYIIANATTDELKLLRGKTIECVSLIGELNFVTNALLTQPGIEPGTSYVVHHATTLLGCVQTYSEAYA